MSTPTTSSAGNTPATQTVAETNTANQTNTNNNNGQGRTHGFMYKAFVHGRVEVYFNNPFSNHAPAMAIVASTTMYLGLAFLGHAAAVFAQAYTAGVAFESALLLTATPISIAVGTALALVFIIYFGTRTIVVSRAASGTSDSPEGAANSPEAEPNSTEEPDSTEEPEAYSTEAWANIIGAHAATTTDTTENNHTDSQFSTM